MTDTGTMVAAPYPGKDQSERVRLFRADTPHDVASACLVAALSPGQDYLAVSADKAAADPTDYLLTMRAVARAHRWVDIIDISNLPISDHNWLRPDARSRRLTRYRDMRRSFELLSATLARRVPPEIVDELFVTCLDHPDIQVMSQVVTDATISYLPHGLGSIHEMENETGVRWTTSPSAGRRAHHALTGMLKRPIWGKAATPPLSFEIEASYTFHRYPAFGRERHDLTFLMTPDVMHRLFVALPPHVRRVYELADGKGGSEPYGLLLLSPSEDRGSDYPYGREISGFAYLASQLVTRRNLTRIVIKPHPRNSERWVSRVADAVRCELPQVEVTVVPDYPGIPVEIAASAMNIAAAAGIGSTAVQALARIYRIPTYSPDRLLRELNAHDPKWARRWEDWIRANHDLYTSI